MRRLTPRQRDILRLLGEGYRSREAAEELGISYETLRTNRMDAMRKLRAHTIAEACVKYDRERAEIEAAELLRARIMREVG